MKAELLTRKEFKQAVLARDGGMCVFCKTVPAVDAHHIMDRKLWPDGGYYLDNGASVCADHHWDCERLIISTLDVRLAAKIRVILLPPDLDPSCSYDKWGNIECPWSTRHDFQPYRHKERQ